MNTVPHQESPGRSEPGESHPGHPGGFTAGPRPTLPPKRPSVTRRIFWFLVFVVIAAVLLSGVAWFEYVFKPKMIAAYMAGNVPPPTAVATVKAAAEPVPQSLEAIGTLTAVHQVTIAPQVDG